MGMMRIHFFFFALLLFVGIFAEEPEDYLSLGDNALASDNFQEAIMLYRKGAGFLVPEESSLITTISIYTNLGTSLSSLGQEAEAAEEYRKALGIYDEEISEIVDKTMKADATAIAAQASFFLGLVYEELEENQMAANAYAYANTLDNLHWSSLANLGAVLKDKLIQADEALMAYNKAYDLLAQREVEPTDPPTNPEFIMAELQYRIAYILMENPNRKCAMTDKPDEEVSCQELASHALSLALKFHPGHETAKHMLATLTVDATMKRASNEYVKSLFDDYAQK
jgi:tetratricopeptide (TPR) repeat protein